MVLIVNGLLTLGEHEHAYLPACEMSYGIVHVSVTLSHPAMWITSVKQYQECQLSEEAMDFLYHHASKYATFCHPCWETLNPIPIFRESNWWRVKSYLHVLLWSCTEFSGHMEKQEMETGGNWKWKWKWKRKWKLEMETGNAIIPYSWKYWRE